MAKNNNRNQNKNNQNRARVMKEKEKKTKKRTSDFIREFSSFSDKKKKNQDTKKSLSAFFEDLKRAKKFNLPIEDVLVDYENDILTFYFRESYRNKDLLADLLNKMGKKNIAKAFKNLSKDDEYNFPVEYVSLIETLLRTALMENSNINLTSKETEIYTDILEKLLKKPIKKISKATKISNKDFLSDLFTIVPSHSRCFGLKVDKKKDVSEFHGNSATIVARKLVRKLVSKAQQGDVEVLGLTLKQFEKLFESLMTEFTFPFIAVVILCERKGNPTPEVSQFLATLTDFALAIMESAGKTEIRMMLEMYIEQRIHQQSGNNGNLDEKFIKLSQVDAEKYPRVVAQVTRMMAKNPKTSVYFN